jgi:transketolase
MRKEFVEVLRQEMSQDHRIRVITADLGFGVLDPVRAEFTDRFYNVGAAEQLMVGVAIGMANEGLIPVCYSMSSFLLYRPFELLRNYANHEGTPIKLVGSGRDRDYSHDGISHWAHDDEQVLAVLPNIKIYKPKSIKELEEQFEEFLYSDKPAYLNLTRKI